MNNPDRQPGNSTDLSWRKTFCCALLAVTTIAATSAYAKKPQPPGLFSRSAGESMQRLPNQALAGKSRMVKINKGQLRSGRLSLDLPGGIKLEAVRDLRQKMDDKRFSWVGHAAGNSKDRVVIGVSGDAVAGTFTHRGKLFKLEPRPNGTHVLSQVSASEPAPELEPIPVISAAPDPASADQITNDTPTAQDPGPQVIDVLVAYTPEVQSRYGTEGAEALIIQAVAETNQAYANSGISSRLNLVHAVMTNYTESGSMTTDLSRLRATNDGHMDELHALRNSYGADLVSLIEHEPQYCGYAYRMDNLSASFASSAFSVIHHSCANGYYSFAHELGHNQGAHHDPDNGIGAIYDYAHGYQDPNRSFRTVMAFNCSGGCTRVNHFSNPDVLYNGKPTGDPAYSDNARTLDETAATIANFEQEVEQTLPTAPSDLEATPASVSEIDLNWTDRSDDETGFILERSENGLNYTEIASLPASTSNYADNNLAPDTLYYYRIRAFNSAGYSAYSDIAITATDALPPPSAPSGLNATAGGTNRITLNWTDTADDETGFVLERSENGQNYAQIASLAANTAGYTDNNLSAGTRYYYRVRAFNSAGYSSYSGTAITATDALPPPGAPSGLKATASGTDRIIINWTDTANDETGFALERSETGQSYAQIASLAANTTRYTDNNLSADTRYYYRVRAYNSAGYSAYSGTAFATTDTPPAPSAPSDLNATAAGADRIIISWTDTSDSETGFILQRRLHGSSQWVAIGTIGADVTSYIDHGLQPETLYYYRAAAYNDWGQSTNSNSNSARTDELPVSKFRLQQDFF